VKMATGKAAWFVLFAVAALSGARAGEAPPGKPVPFEETDCIKGPSGELLHGRITRVTRDTIQFWKPGWRKAIPHSRNQFAVRHWAGVTDAAERLKYAREVRSRILEALARADKAPDLGHMIKSLDEAAGYLKTIRFVELPGDYDTAEESTDAGVLSREFRLLRGDLSQLRFSKARLDAYHRQVVQARVMVAQLRFEAAARMCRLASRSLAGVGAPSLLERLGFNEQGKRPADLAATAETLTRIDLDLIEGRTPVTRLGDLAPVLERMEQQRALLTRPWAVALASATVQKALRDKTDRHLAALRDVLERLDDHCKVAARVRVLLKRLENLPKEEAEQFVVIAAEIAVELPRLLKPEKAPPLDQTTLAIVKRSHDELRSAFERLRSTRADLEQSGWVAYHRKTYARDVQSWGRILHDFALLSEGLSLDAVRSIRARVDLCRQSLSQLAAGPGSRLTGASGPTAAAVSELREKAKKSLAQVDQLVSLLKEAEIVLELEADLRARVPGENDVESLTRTRLCLEQARERMLSRQGQGRASIGAVLAALDRHCCNAVNLAGYRIETRRADDKCREVRLHLDAGRLGRARGEMRVLREHLRSLQTCADALGKKAPAPLLEAGECLGSELARSINSRRVEAGWVVPPEMTEAVPASTANLWLAFRTDMDLGNTERAAKRIDALDALPLSDAWAQRLRAGRVEMKLAAARRALAGGHGSEARRLLQGAAASRTSGVLEGRLPAARAAELELNRLDTAARSVRTARAQRTAAWVFWGVVGAGMFVAALLFRPARSAEDVPEVSARRKNRRGKRNLKAVIDRALAGSTGIENMVEQILSSPHGDVEQCGICIAWIRATRDGGGNGGGSHKHGLVSAREWLVRSLSLDVSGGVEGARWRAQISEEAVGVFPDDVALLLCFGDNAAHLKDNVRAETAYRAILELKPGLKQKARAYLGLARALLGQERPDEALELLETALDDEQLKRAAGVEMRRWLGICVMRAARAGRVDDEKAAQRTLGLLAGA